MVGARDRAIDIGAEINGECTEVFVWLAVISAFADEQTSWTPLVLVQPMMVRFGHRSRWCWGVSRLGFQPSTSWVEVNRLISCASPIALTPPATPSTAGDGTPILIPMKRSIQKPVLPKKKANTRQER